MGRQWGMLVRRLGKVRRSGGREEVLWLVRQLGETVRVEGEVCFRGMALSFCALATSRLLRKRKTQVPLPWNASVWTSLQCRRQRRKASTTLAPFTSRPHASIYCILVLAVLCCWGKGQHRGPEPAPQSLLGWKVDTGPGVVASSSHPWHLCLPDPEKRSTPVLFAPQGGWRLSHSRIICQPPVAVSAPQPLDWAAGASARGKRGGRHPPEKSVPRAYLNLNGDCRFMDLPIGLGTL